MSAGSVARFDCVMVFCLTTTTNRAAASDRGKLRKQLIKHQGKRARVYKDSQGIPTIGVGFDLTRTDAKKMSASCSKRTST